MAKTQNQTQNITIKKEEEDSKDTQILHSVNNTAGNNSKITKRISSTSMRRILPVQEIKVEEDIDVKSLLRTPPTLSAPKKAQYISQEQIKQLIDTIENDNMLISTAALKLKIHFKTASYYYNIYKNDPEKKIPVPLKKINGNKNFCTQEQITTLIKHIVGDGMTIREASALVDMGTKTALGYYRKYLEDPNRNIPMQVTQKAKQEQIKSLIGYIVNDKMPIKAASKKVNMGYQTGRKYYQMFLEDPNHDLPVPDPQGMCSPRCTQDQVNTLISSIVDDKMTVVDAAKKVNMTTYVGKRYYKKYMNDPNHRIPKVGFKNSIHHRAIPQDKIRALIGYITEDKMTLTAASRKAEMSIESGRKYYDIYRNNPSFINTTPNQNAISPGCTQEQIKELISFIVDDKMTVKDASEKANMSPETGEKYYQQYLNGLHRDIPTHIVSHQHCTEEQISTLIRCITDDEMTLKAASKKANMSYETGIKYFQECMKYRQKHVNEPNSNTPTPNHVFHSHPCIPEQNNTLIRCTDDDNMTILAATENMSANTGHQYVNDPNNGAPTHIGRFPNCTQEQITDLIRYICEDKMSVEDASKKANMITIAGHIYYMIYLQNCH